MEVIGNPKLMDVDPMRVYRNLRVCHLHFTIKDKSSNMYLVRTAIPSQRLPSIQGTECDYYYYMNNYFIQYKIIFQFVTQQLEHQHPSPMA